MEHALAAKLDKNVPLSMLENVRELTEASREAAAANDLAFANFFKRDDLVEALVKKHFTSARKLKLNSSLQEWFDG